MRRLTDRRACSYDQREQRIRIHVNGTVAADMDWGHTGGDRESEVVIGAARTVGLQPSPPYHAVFSPGGCGGARAGRPLEQILQRQYL